MINDIYDDGQRPRHHRLSQMDQRQGGREDGVCGGGKGEDWGGGKRKGDVVLRGDSGHVEVSDGQSVSPSVKGWLSDYLFGG